ncbi:MAG: hypothetical protein IT385_01850 [Deltaproteobacteria bacterium]|nr:hypothetical protein [Deltaproteobacteria bacterium]
MSVAAPEPVITEPAPPDPLLAVVARARACTASVEELRALSGHCLPEHGCRALPLDGELALGARLAVPSDAERVVLVLSAAEGADACGARARRSRAIVGGSWDVIEPAWGAYVQPRVVLEARRGRAVAGREVLRERGATTTDEAVCLPPEMLADARLEAFEELRFQVADTRAFTGEEGRFPCRLEARALALGQPKRPAM